MTSPFGPNKTPPDAFWDETSMAPIEPKEPYVLTACANAVLGCVDFERDDCCMSCHHDDEGGYYELPCCWAPPARAGEQSNVYAQVCCVTSRWLRQQGRQAWAKCALAPPAWLTVDLLALGAHKVAAARRGPIDPDDVFRPHRRIFSPSVA